MRSEDQVLTLITSVAEEDERIRAVVLNGSRVNPNVPKDDFQDFDVIYLVNDLSSFKNDFDWIDVFGERRILQMPNSLEIGEPYLNSKEDRMIYLMLFKDLNRIDLTLVDTKNKQSCNDSLTRVLLDKDDLFPAIADPSEEDYLIRKPTQKEFADCCNEFWWVSTYVVKGIGRNECIYAKEMLENPLRKMFMKLLAWHIGSKNDFSINLGAHYRFMKRHATTEMWARILRTYPDLNSKNIWASLDEMMNIFHETALDIASKLNLNYNVVEANNTMQYIQEIENKITKLY